MLRREDIRHGGVSRTGEAIEVRVREAGTLDSIRRVLAQNLTQMQITPAADGSRLTVSFKPESLREVQDQALKQNITTLHNRVNELGVAEPVIQQQVSEGVTWILSAILRPTSSRKLSVKPTMELRSPSLALTIMIQPIQMRTISGTLSIPFSMSTAISSISISLLRLNLGK